MAVFSLPSTIALLLLIVVTTHFLNVANAVSPANINSTDQSIFNDSVPQHIFLETKSDQGTFEIKVNWTTSNIGRENTFALKFIDPDTRAQIEMVKYDIMLLQDGKELPTTIRLNQTASEQGYVFSESGSFVLEIANIDDLGENASIPIEVTPEFPASVGLTAMAVLIVMFMVAIRPSAPLFLWSPIKKYRH